jgi:hypothetical protein
MKPIRLDGEAYEEGTAFSVTIATAKRQQRTAYDTGKLPGRDIAPLWQRRFYDHALRASESIEIVAGYIWNNPVRAGLVSEADDYPFSGSLVWDARRSSGSEDPDLRGRDPPSNERGVGEGLQTLAQARQSR